MDLDRAIEMLRSHQAELEQRGVIHAAVFGSVARRRARPNSDIDILIELDPDRSIDVFAYAGIKRFIADLYAAPVDVVNQAALKEGIRSKSIEDAAYAF